MTLILTCSLSSLIAPKVEAAEPEVIRVWFSQYEAENAAMQTIADQYMLETGRSVEIIPRINVFNAVSDLVNNATLDERPDIVFMQAPDIGRLVSSGYLESLTDDIDEDLRNRFVDVAFSAFRLNGEYYGIGYSVDTSGLLYNKDIISEEELPETWEEFFELAEAKTVIEDSKVTVHGALLNSRDMWFTYPLIKLYGGYYYGTYPNGEYNPYDVGLDSEGMIDYINRIKEAGTQGLVLTNKIHGESEIVSRFANNQVGMILYGLWYASILQQKGINYGIASLPDPGDGTISRALTTVQGFVINHFSLHKDLGWDFLQYLLEDDNQQLLIEAGNEFDKKLGTRNPANLAVIESDYIQSSDILSSLSALNCECEPFPNIPEGPIWYNYTTTVFQSIFFSDDFSDEDAVKAKLSELADKIRDDVRLMNYQAERIEIPSWLLPVTISILVVLVGLFILWKRAKSRKNPSYLKKPSWKETVIAWGLMAPLLCLLLLFYVYPIIHNFFLSLTDYSGINLREYGLIGFANYKDVFVAGLDGLISMVVWTLLFATSVVAISFVLGTLLATLMQKVGLKVARIYRIVFILPWVIPTVITLLMWQGLLETENGLVNQLIGLIGIPNIPWLSDPYMAKVSTIMVMTWFSFPYFMVIASGLLQSIPKDYYDAAKVDGASSFYIFTSITLPLVFKALIPTLIMSFIMQFNQFGVYILTAGGPASDKIGAPGATDLLITYVFNTAFNTNRYAIAAAYSVLIFLFVGLFALVSMRITRKVAES
jgi:arabinogalactan oligomer/maltooligosaccharide transport system permease protein